MFESLTLPADQNVRLQWLYWFWEPDSILATAHYANILSYYPGPWCWLAFVSWWTTAFKPPVLSSVKTTTLAPTHCLLVARVMNDNTSALSSSRGNDFYQLYKLFTIWHLRSILPHKLRPNILTLSLSLLCMSIPLANKPRLSCLQCQHYWLSGGRQPCPWSSSNVGDDKCQNGNAYSNNSTLRLCCKCIWSICISPAGPRNAVSPDSWWRSWRLQWWTTRRTRLHRWSWYRW